MPYISEQGLKRLDSYKYKSGGYSKLDNKMNPFWEWVESQLPKNWAPNFITLIGFGIMIASYVVMLWYDDKFEKKLPRWVYIFTAVCQFIYQTMDAVDGKRARNAKASSPLGQLFDHGCDSFSMTFIILSMCQTVRLGPTTELLFFTGLLQLGFYVANWGEYHSGVLTTSMQYFGVTEAELLVILVIFITGITGPEIWDVTTANVLQNFGVNVGAKGVSSWMGWILNAPIKILCLRLMTVIISLIIAYFFVTTMKVAKNKALALKQFLSVGMLLLALHFWSYLEVFRKDAALIILSSALIFSLITCRLIICSLTESKTQLIHWEVVVFAGFFLLLRFVVPMFQSRSLEKVVLGLLPLYVVASVAYWAHGVIVQISDHLGIHCFSLKKKDKKKVQ